MNCYQKKQNVVLVDLVAQKNKKQIEFENKVTEDYVEITNKRLDNLELTNKFE